MHLQIEYCEGDPTMIFPEIFDGKVSEIFKEDLMTLSNQGHLDIIIDFSKTTMIDISALGKLMVSQKRLKNRGGELRIKNVVNHQIQDLFRAIKLNEVIPIEGME